MAARTSSAWPSGFTLGEILIRCWSVPIKNVVRSMPITFFPYMFFSLRTSNCLQTASATSARFGEAQPRMGSNPGGEGLAGRVVGLSGEEACDGNVLVQGVPMEAAVGDPKLFALLRGAMQEPGKPRQRHAESPAIAQVGPDAVGIEAH